VLKWAWRRPAVAALILTVCLSLLGLGALASFLVRRSEAEKQDLREEIRGLQEKLKARDRGAGALHHLGAAGGLRHLQAWAAGRADAPPGLQRLRQQPELQPDLDRLEAELRRGIDQARRGTVRAD